MIIFNRHNTRFGAKSKRKNRVSVFFYSISPLLLWRRRKGELIWRLFPLLSLSPSPSLSLIPSPLFGSASYTFYSVCEILLYACIKVISTTTHFWKRNARNSFICILKKCSRKKTDSHFLNLVSCLLKSSVWGEGDGCSLIYFQFLLHSLNGVAAK